VRDDDLVGEDVVLDEHALDRTADVLAGDTLAEQVLRGPHPGLAGALGTADPCQLGLGLHAPPQREVLALGTDVDALFP
jgi:hypothetical protein